MLPPVAVGLGVSAALAWFLVSGGTGSREHPYAVQYLTDVQHGDVLAAAYVVAAIAPLLLSAERALVAFGVLDLAALVTVAVLARRVFVSLWCSYAAVVSVLVLVHLRRRDDAGPDGDSTLPDDGPRSVRVT